MQTHQAVVLYLNLHQAVLVVFSIWHLCYYCNTDQYNFGIGGFFIGFPIHCMLFASWYLLNYSPNVGFWMFTAVIGGWGWLLSWCFMVSLDHWSVMGFLVIFLILPVFVAGLFVKSRRAKKIELLQKKKQ
jgi:hypothetical protein